MVIMTRAPLPPLPPPDNVGRYHRLIHFRHPAYSDNEPDLLRLHAVDGDGIDYDVAFLACCIVTSNTWHDGWLAQKNISDSSSDSFIRVHRPDDGLLRGDKYYFLLGHHPSDYKYPVLSSFEHWRFPHDGLPSPWSKLHIPSVESPPHVKSRIAAITRDGTCRISGYFDAVEVAHVVPVSVGHWFNSNGMERYCLRPDELHCIDDEQNLLVLRRDLHYLFDTRRFTLLAKTCASVLDPVPDGSPTAKLVVHTLLPKDSKQLVELYHHRTPHAITGVSPSLLFARFSWSIFTEEVLTFFNGFGKRAVLLFDTETGNHHTRQLFSNELSKQPRLFAPYSRSRSISPRKRTADAMSEPHYGNMVDRLVSEEWGEDKDDGLLLDIEQEEYTEPRGRRRKRSWDRGWEGDSPPDLSKSIASAGTIREATTDAAESPPEMMSHQNPGDFTGKHTEGSDHPKKRRLYASD